MEGRGGKKGKGQKERNFDQVGKEVTYKMEDEKGYPGMERIYMPINFSMIKKNLRHKKFFLKAFNDRIK